MKGTKKQPTFAEIIAQALSKKPAATPNVPVGLNVDLTAGMLGMRSYQEARKEEITNTQRASSLTASILRSMGP